MNSKWYFFVVFTILWLVGTTVYSFNYIVVPDGSTYRFECVKFIFLSISAFGVLFSTVLSSYNSLESTSNIKDKIAFDKTENSFAYMLRWDSDSLKEARDETRRIKKNVDEVSPRDLLANISGEESLERSVITMFNFFEEIHLSIQEKRVNEKILKQAFAGVYIDIYWRFKGWIDANITGEQKKNLEGLNTLWGNLQS